MRRLIPVVLCSIALSAVAADQVIRLPAIYPIDLDKPGALEALQRDNPKHYEAVMKRVEEAQKVEYSETGTQNLGMFWKPNPTENPAYGSLVKPSYPAQMRIMVIVEMQPYEITVHYTKDPGSLMHAR